MEVQIGSKKHIYNHSEAFVLESGKSIKDLSLTYHTLGRFNAKKTNVVWVFHALTANSDPSVWWEEIVGANKLFNPESHFIVCVNTLGSPYGSAAPQDLNFPQFTVRDVVKAQQIIAATLNIDHIYLAIGASFGGYQALEFTYSFTGKVEHLVLLATAAKESPWGIAIHEAQRLALKTDASFGDPNGGTAGIKAARSIAMLTYRTDEAFEATQQDADDRLDNFKAASYLQYQGDKFADRFNALSYFYLSKCLDSHNIGRDRGGIVKALNEIESKTLVIGISSDKLVPPRHQHLLAAHIPKAVYHEIDSKYGHDGFLVESEKISNAIKNFIGTHKSTVQTRRAVLKFGGKSLFGEKGIQQVLSIVEKELALHPLAVVVSARGNTTAILEDIFLHAQEGKETDYLIESFFQENQVNPAAFKELAERLKSFISALSLLQTDDAFAYDKLLSFGELLSAEIFAQALKEKGVKAVVVDARNLIYTRKLLDDFEVDLLKSKEQTLKTFSTLSPDEVPVIPGFIATSEQGKTVTLGKNGSNYSATLIASFINALEVQNWSNVPGLFSANPAVVKDAIPIEEISYRQANELANFGTHILHPKTILPLVESGIPLKIKSSLHPDAKGTIISKEGSKKGIKAVSVIQDVSLVSIEGRGLLDNVGIDGRIFDALRKKDISVRLISQASSERGIGFVINTADAKKAELLLLKEFDEELRLQHISNILVREDIAIICIVGRHNYSLEKAIHALRRNRIWMHLISNSISGEHISLVVDRNKLDKAVKVVHSQVVGARKRINLFAFGKGTVGGALINQITSTQQKIIEERNLEIKVVGIADTKGFVFNEDGFGTDWRDRLESERQAGGLEEVLIHLKQSHLENVVIADNTSSQQITDAYLRIIDGGFDLVASNKKGNSSSYEFYASLRKKLRQKGRMFYYETNVGAGLPIIDTLKHLYQSSDQITRIRGVFSGSLSYLFNNFSESEAPFSEILKEAGEKGFTEPDPREDLSGMDVARKLIILAREIGMTVEYDEVEIQNLVPSSMKADADLNTFWKEKELLNTHFEAIKSRLKPDHVLRYTGDLDVEHNSLRVKLVEVPKSQPLGGIKNADSIFEIFTQAYGAQPIVVQGAGAGAEVTARGVYSDILKIGAQL